jgi:rod shape determining protein RodA
MKFLLGKIRDYIKNTDKWLWGLCFVLSGIGVVLLYGILQTGYAPLLDISRRNLFVQCAATLLGLFVAFILSLIDYRFLLKTWVVHMPLAYVLMILTFFFGFGAAERPDDKRWLLIPFINQQIQPAELFKISFILAFALHIYKLGDSLNRLAGIASLAVHAAVPVLLIHFQGDDGTALLTAFIAVTMLFVAGVKWRYFALGAVGVGAAVPLAWLYIMDDFQKDRILTLINQATADPLGTYYQQYQAKVAVAMGGVTGVGLTGAKHVYVPEMHNDFVFSFLCESFGFMGALGVLTLMLFLCFKIFYNGCRMEDRRGTLICSGVFATILFQFCINVGMCLSVMPVIGNTFPFLSYGGSSVLSTYLAVGLALSVYMGQKRDLFFD